MTLPGSRRWEARTSTMQPGPESLQHRGRSLSGAIQAALTPFSSGDLGSLRIHPLPQLLRSGTDAHPSLLLIPRTLLAHPSLFPTSHCPREIYTPQGPYFIHFFPP